MAWVETRITRTTQPQDAVGVDTTYSKLKFASTLGVSTRNEVNGRPNTWTSPNRVVTQKGYAAKFNGTSSFIQLPTSNLVAGNALTISFWANMTSATGVMACFVGSTYTALIGILSGKGLIFEFSASKTTANQGVATASIPSGLVHVTYVSGPTESAVYFNGQRQTLTNLADAWGAPAVGNHSIGNRRNGSTAQFFNGTLSDFCVFEGALSQEEITANYQNPWAVFEPEVQRVWIDDTVSTGGSATVIPIGVQATGSVGTPSATGAATTTPAGVSASSAVGTPVAVGGASIPATALPAGVQATGAVGTVTAIGAAVAQPAGVTASGAVGTPVAIGESAGVTVVYPAGVQAVAAVGTPGVIAAARVIPIGVQAVGEVGEPLAYAGDTPPVVATSNYGFEMSAGKRYYIKRKGKILLFNSAEQADDYLAVEQQATVVTSRGAKKRIAAKLVKVAPIETIELEPVTELLSRYMPDVSLPNLLKMRDIEQVLKMQQQALLMQDDEDIELLLMTL